MKKLPNRFSVLLMAVALSGCGVSGLSDEENKEILEDVSYSSSNVFSIRGVGNSEFGKSGGNGKNSSASEDERTSEGRPRCGHDPIGEFCLVEVETYCAEYAPPDPSEIDPDELGKESFEERKEMMDALLECLDENLSDLNEECQNVVEKAPNFESRMAFKVSSRARENNAQNDSFANSNGHSNSPNSGPGAGGPPQCSGRSLLAACISDAQTYCSTEVPVKEEVDAMSEDERRETVESLISCLEAEEEISDRCSSALENVPKS